MESITTKNMLILASGRQRKWQLRSASSERLAQGPQSTALRPCASLASLASLAMDSLTYFTPVESGIGGLMIGLSAGMAYLVDGKITGISGIMGPFLRGVSSMAGFVEPQRRREDAFGHVGAFP